MTIINCDMGEGFGQYHIGDDEGLMPLIEVANVACGFHASDFNHMRRTVQLAKRHGVKVVQPHTPTQFMKVTMDQVLQASKDRKAVLDGITAALA
jgi:lactam utilization protein B